MFFYLKVCYEQKRMGLEIVNSNYVDKGVENGMFCFTAISIITEQPFLHS